MAFTDVLGDYLSNRFDRATQPFNDPEAYLRQRLLDEEEERKKREREEEAKRLAEETQAQQRATEQAQAAQAQPQPGQPAFPGQSGAVVPTGMAAPNQYGSAIAQGASTEGPAPTQGGPVAPDQANIEEQRRLQQAQEAAQMAQPTPAPQPAVPAQPAPAAAPQPQTAPQMTMEERIAAAAQRAQARAAQQTAQPQVAPQPQLQAAPQPAAPAAPVAPAPVAQAPAVPAMPQFGPGVQVASTEPGAGVAEAARAAQPAAPAPAPAPEPAWIAASNEAGNDFAKLLDVAAKFPEARGAIQEKLKSIVENQRKADEAQKIVQAAQAGDLKAMNKLEQSLRPTRGKEREEVTVGDYLKAYMYARLGLNELSQQVQQKIAGSDTKFGQVQLGDTTWSVETNAKTGEIIRAKDDEGNIATPNTLNRLAAAGQKFGTQAFSQTGEIHITPDGKQVVKVFNSTTGRTQWTDVATGEKWNGQGTPKPQSISTAAAKTDYNLAADLYRKHSGNVLDMMKEYEMIKGPMTNEARGEFLQRYGYGGTVPTPAQATGGAPAQAMPAAPAPAVQTMPAAPAQPVRPGAPAAAAPAQAPVQAPAVSTAPIGTGGRVPGGVSTAGISGMKTQQEIGKAAAIENINVQGARSKAFNDILDTEVRPQAQAGDTVSSIRKQQFAIFDRPGIDTNKIFGLYNAAQEAPGDQKLSIIRDIFGGVFKPEAEVSQRLAQLNLSPAEKAALQEYNIANQQINAATLKRTAGAGSVSDAEQKANKESNVDPTKIPALGAYNAMAQSQFDADKARWKADWALNSTATNALQLDKEWRRESQRLSDIYRDIAVQRIKFINANGNTYNAVREGYRRFPVPEYDPGSGTWKKTKPLGAILGGQ